MLKNPVTVIEQQLAQIISRLDMIIQILRPPTEAVGIKFGKPKR